MRKSRKSILLVCGIGVAMAVLLFPPPFFLPFWYWHAYDVAQGKEINLFPIYASSVVPPLFIVFLLTLTALFCFGPDAEK